uniref:Capsid protein n=1 Tax=Iberian lynx associated circovirus 1 TaxID=3228841 RepID=A0AAU7VEQ2_9CIRC
MPRLLRRYRRRRIYRRRRPRLRRYRKYRIRRLIGSTYYDKLTKIELKTFTFQSGTQYKAESVSWKLNEFIGTVSWDYYRLKYVSWTLRPATPTDRWTFWGIGISIIDHDDTAITPNPNTFTYQDNSTRKIFYPHKGHRRFFKPKPWLLSQGSQSVGWDARNTFWANSNTGTTTWTGIKYVINGQGTNDSFHYTKLKLPIYSSNIYL